MTAPILGNTLSPSRAITQGGGNVALAYSYLNVHYQAVLRCTKLAINYQLNSEESHSRQTRAFYPHRRNQGTFALTFAHLSWKEYQQAMGWFARFSRQSLAMANVDPAVWIHVSLPARNFNRKGIPTTGMVYGDHTAAMVYSPTITFVSVQDGNDPNNTIRADPRWGGRAGVSAQSNKGIDPFQVAFFYPTSRVNRPGQLNEALYGPTGSLPPISAGDAQSLILQSTYPSLMEVPAMDRELIGTQG